MKPIYSHNTYHLPFTTSILVALLWLLPVCILFAQQRPPFSDKTVKTEDGTLLMPYTKGEVEKNITGNYKPVFEKICSIITSWDSINPPQGMQIDCFGYEKRLEIYFRNYGSYNGQRFTEEGGPHLEISVNDPLSIVGNSVASGIYLCPQITADFHGYPIYDGERIVVTKTKTPLYVPVTQEEYLKTLIAEEEKKASKYTPPGASDYQVTLLEMEKTYKKLLETDKEAAEEFKQQMVEFKKEIAKEPEAGQADTNPVSLFKKELAAMTDEEKKLNAYHGGESISQLMPYEQRQYGDAMIKINPALIRETAKSGIHLLVLWCSLVAYNATDVRNPRLFNKGNEGNYHANYLMSKLYEDQKIWDNIFHL
jgi:hypothetical protein